MDHAIWSMYNLNFAMTDFQFDTDYIAPSTTEVQPTEFS